MASRPMSAPGRLAAARHQIPGFRRVWSRLISLALICALVTPAWAGATATRIELLLVGVDCALCVQGLEQRLRSLPGAQQVRLELERGRLSLLVDAGSTVTDQTLRTLMRDAGFVVRQIRRSPVAP